MRYEGLIVISQELVKVRHGKTGAGSIAVMPQRDTWAMVKSTLWAAYLCGFTRSVKTLAAVLRFLLTRALPRALIGPSTGAKRYPEKRRAWKTWTPRKSDLVVCVPPKSGTTMLMHIAHQIRVSGKEPTFECQYEVMPWIEVTPGVLGHDLKDEQRMDGLVLTPRVFKSHLPASEAPAGCRYIYCFRDLADLIVSEYFFHDWESKGFSMTTFGTAVAVSPITHLFLLNLLDWWERRHDPMVLFLFFDDLLERHKEVVRDVGTFMLGSPPPEPIVEKVTSQSTHAWMCDHRSLFSDLLLKRANGEPSGLGTNTGKVRQSGGQSGDGKRVLPSVVHEILLTKWQAVVTPRTGFETLVRPFPRLSFSPTPSLPMAFSRGSLLLNRGRSTRPSSHTMSGGHADGEGQGNVQGD